MKHTLKRSPFAPLLIVGFLFGIVVILTSTVKADDQPTPEDYANLEDIKANQKVLEETREAHERFMQAKAWNEAEVAELGKNGWTPNWETMELERF
jgi:hypothetical protein